MTKKRIGWGAGVLLLVAVCIGAYYYHSLASKIVRLTPEYTEKMKKVVTAQNEAAIKKPPFRKRIMQPPNPLKNIYFGDTHVHTSLSFDSYLFGNRIGLEDAYRFALGEQLQLKSGEILQKYVPLDFIAVTDHSESFGLHEGCADPSISQGQKEFCKKFDMPSLTFFIGLKNSGAVRPPKRVAELCGDDGVFCEKHGKTTWAAIRQTADKYNQPGVFTAFQAYEYSPILENQGMLHRNVIFRNNTAPDVAFSLYEAPTVIELWQVLEKNCTGTCEFLTIPHNMNYGWGLFYNGKTIDGDIYSKKDWALRDRSEPLAEIFQIKGNSECGIGAGAVDEECAFEQFFPLCKDDQTSECVGPNSFAREALKKGLVLEQDLGFNPLQFGFIGSTDTHNSNPGDTEEFDWRGQNGIYSSPAKKRLEAGNLSYRKTIGRNPGGLAGIWAVENTRDALFDSMKNRETYGTSGTRIRLRFFGGWDWHGDILNRQNMIEEAYRTGVPMGGILKRNLKGGKPNFLVWALRDPNAAKLQRIQMVKGWIEDGERREEVFDIACSDGLTPDTKTKRCPDNGARVNIDTCEVTADNGAAELKIMWEDENFKSHQSSFYYVRVLENPTCRWSTYDAIRLRQKPRKDVPRTIRDRAWSSPIWYTPF